MGSCITYTALHLPLVKGNWESWRRPHGILGHSGALIPHSFCCEQLNDPFPWKREDLKPQQSSGSTSHRVDFPAKPTNV